MAVYTCIGKSLEQNVGVVLWLNIKGCIKCKMALEEEFCATLRLFSDCMP